MRSSRDLPAWCVGLLIAAGCATAESEDPPNSDSLSHQGGSSGTAGKPAALGGTSTGVAGSAVVGSGGMAHAGSASGGKSQGGANTAGTANEGGAADQPMGGAGPDGSGGKAGGGGTTAGSSQSGKAGSGAAGTSGSSGSGGGGTGGGGGKIGCDDPLFVLCDDFEDGNASGWATSGGTWTVVQSGSFVYKGAVGGYQAYAGDAALTDQIVEAKIKGITFGGSGSSYRVGLIARRTSTSNFYAVTLDEAGDLRVLKGSSSPSGSSGTCDSVPVSPAAAGFTLRLEVTGASGAVHLKTFLDGDQIHDCTTTSGTLTAGAAGLYTYGSKSVAEFDDFTVSIP